MPELVEELAAPADPRDCHSTVTTIFCDGEVRKVRFHRRRNGLRFYTMRIGQALLGVPYPKHVAEREREQHIVMVTLIERDLDSDLVKRTISSGFVDCPHTHPAGIDY